MRRARALLAAALLVLLPATLDAGPDRLTLRIATIAPEGSPWHEIMIDLCQVMEKNAPGKLRCRIYNNAVRGDEAAQVAAVRDGQLEGAGSSAGGALGVLPELAPLWTPYLFRDETEVDLVFSGLKSQLQKACARRGMVFAAMADVGFRHLGTKVPVPDATWLRGKRFRSMENPFHAEYIRRWGAESLTLGVSGVLPALETGRIDVWDQPPVYALGVGWFDVSKHYTLTGHLFDPGLLLLSKRFLDKLPASVRGHITDGIEPITSRVRARVRQLNRDVLEILRQRGVSVHQPSPALLAGLQEHGPEARAWLRGRIDAPGRELMDAVDRVLAKARRAP